ncbi:metallophosphoesterase [Saccharothrix sp. S26]|uniref:metallophosphoesterase family protein n=1 Tax=Saccharothrix sp. S26 TaxID=2907215 RepID=UPI001F24706A|nr:metallophosphoesterase [Saccharothrix sp. S26]MCE6999425.1 metallophosphoesterase [Saccharothrix sp. S26]
MPDGSLPTSVVRFTDATGRTVGAGVVVGGHVVTCAHVVNLALGRDPHETGRPTQPVDVHFPALNGESVPARVHHWAVRENTPGDDVATLHLYLPARVTPARLIAPPVDHVAGRLVRPDDAVPREPGGPVWDPVTGRVAGIAARDGHTIPADRLRQELPDEPDDLTVLHLAGTRFGSGNDVLQPPDFAELRPDLVVFTGDLTEHGRPDEFEQGFRFLAELADAVKLPRERVVVVPGSRDVNKLACEAYFQLEQAWGRTPTPPFWPKWGPFAAAFQEFYGSRFSFTPDEPWTLFDYPELGVVVAGLNSTIPVTHEGDGIGLGDRQVERFRELLRQQGGRTLSAVQGQLAVPLTVDFRLMSVRDEPATPAVVPVPGREPRSTASAERANRGLDTFFDRVVEATRVAHPTATVTPRPEKRYVRVSKPRPGCTATTAPRSCCRMGRTRPRASSVTGCGGR